MAIIELPDGSQVDVPDSATDDQINTFLSSIQIDTPQNIASASTPANISQQQVGDIVNQQAIQARSNGGFAAAPTFSSSDLKPTRNETTAEKNFINNEVQGQADFGFRAKLGLASNVNEKANFLAREFGEGNVRAIDNRLFFREFEDTPFKELDPDRLDSGDIADLSGAAIITAPAITGEIVAGPPGAAAGAAAGDVLRQGVASSLGVQDGFRPLETAKEAALAGFGSALFGAPERIVRGATAVPASGAKIFSKNAEKSTAAIEARAIEAEIGVGRILTTGEASGSSATRVIEDYLSTSSKTADRAQGFEIRRLTALNERFDQIIGGATKESTGRKLGAVFQEGSAQASKIRSNNFKRSLNEAFEASGGQSNISVQNTLDTVNSQIDELSTGFGEAGVEGLSARLKREFTNETGFINAKELQNSLAEARKLARGKGNLLPSLTDTSTRQALGSSLLKGLRADLDSAIESGVPGADILKKARDDFARDSELVDSFKNSALAKVAGIDNFTPEKVIKKIQNSEPTEIRKIAKNIRALDVGAVSDLGKVFFADIIEKSQASVADIGAGVPNISYARLATEFNKNQSKLKEIMTPVEFREIQNIASLAAKIKGSTGISPTAQRTEFRQDLNLVSSGLRGTVALLLQRQTANDLARVVFDDEKRSALGIVLRAATNNKGLTKKVSESLGILTAGVGGSDVFAASQNELEDDTARNIEAGILPQQ